jgi:cysteine desulfuration protein SufE
MLFNIKLLLILLNDNSRKTTRNYRRIRVSGRLGAEIRIHYRLGKRTERFAEDKKTEENLIKGCQSKVWLDAEFRDGKLFFNADSDGILPKGIVSLLVRIYSGHSTKEILDSDFDFISKIGLQEFLSPSRANGLMAMTNKLNFTRLHFN